MDAKSNHVPITTSQWNPISSSDLSILSEKAIRKGSRIAFRVFYAALLVPGVFYFLGRCLNWWG